MWVIPFDNHTESTNPLCSVGLMLDPRQHPQRDDVSPEQEFFDFIAQYPSMAAQFAEARAVREWVRAGRIQYSAKQVVGDRWALLGHAAGFVDPLFSKGLYITFATVFLLAHRLMEAKESDNYAAAAFADVERLTLDYVRAADRLVANSYRSFKHPKLWQVYAVMWLLGAYTELLKLNMMRLQAGDDRQAYVDQLVTLKLVGGGYTGFDAVAARVDGIMEKVDAEDETAVNHAVAEINQIFRSLDWIADPFVALLDGKTYLPKNKIRLSLLKPGEGFMRSGAYREHFFGTLTMADILRYGAVEKVRYARPYLDWQHRRQYRRRV